MAMLLAAELSTAPRHRHDHRVVHILTQSATIPLPHLKQIHAKILRTSPQLHQSPESVHLYSRLLHFSALQDLIYTLQLFHNIPNPNTFIYNTLIRAYAHSKLHKNRAFSVFQELLEQETLLPDKHTFPFVLKACAHSFDLIEGKQTHAQVFKRGFASDVYVSNSLIHFYASCGLPKNASKVFDKMPERSLVSWNAIIDALVLAGEFYKALRNVRGDDARRLNRTGTRCRASSTPAPVWGHCPWACGCMMRFDENGSSSSMRMALQVLQSMLRRDVNSWNAAILGLAVHGEAERVFRSLFDRMINEDKLRPNSITFVGVLSACNHRGLVDKGRRYFDLMSSEFKVEPLLQHYGCLVDLLARSGRIDEALDIVSSMPVKPDDVIWRSLLDANCKQGEGIDMSQEMAKRLMEGEGGSSSGAYVLLSRVFASANRWDEVGLIRKLMMDKGVGKEPGCSSVEVDGVVHEFFAGDTTHPQTREIYQLLRWMEERVKMAGYVHDLSQAPLVDEARDGKRDSLRLHSERLAIAFALLNWKPGAAPIRVFKNLRVCKDCHNFIKLISRVMNVEIVMRDRLRFHCFSNGSCSCLDFW
uniref:Pentatricopeptide repeat protein n=1 Tax=Salvia miltiorrhiza TaxID=226208 RepID=A0A678WH38_SALMI|nr:pentatricopeptide repeat protein [Salvia miltiorrhiza]